MVKSTFLLVEQSVIITFLPQFVAQRSQIHGPIQPEFERNFYESQLLLLDTLEKCLNIQPKETTRYDEAMNVKALLKEICHVRALNTFSYQTAHFDLTLLLLNSSSILQMTM